MRRVAAVAVDWWFFIECLPLVGYELVVGAWKDHYHYDGRSGTILLYNAVNIQRWHVHAGKHR